MMIRQVNKYKRGYMCNGTHTQTHIENNETEEGPQKETNTPSNNFNRGKYIDRGKTVSSVVFRKMNRQIYVMKI